MARKRGKKAKLKKVHGAMHSMKGGKKRGGRKGGRRKR